MLMDFVGNMAYLRMACLCSTVSEASAGNTRRSEWVSSNGLESFGGVIHRAGAWAGAGMHESWPRGFPTRAPACGLCMAWASSKHGGPWEGRPATWRLRTLTSSAPINTSLCTQPQRPLLPPFVS